MNNCLSIISNIFMKQNYHLLTDNIRPNLIFEDENVIKKLKKNFVEFNGLNI